MLFVSPPAPRPAGRDAAVVTGAFRLGSLQLGGNPVRGVAFRVPPLPSRPPHPENKSRPLHRPPHNLRLFNLCCIRSSFVFVFGVVRASSRTNFHIWGWEGPGVSFGQPPPCSAPTVTLSFHLIQCVLNRDLLLKAVLACKGGKAEGVQESSSLCRG